MQATPHPGLARLSLPSDVEIRWPLPALGEGERRSTKRPREVVERPCRVLWARLTAPRPRGPAVLPQVAAYRTRRGRQRGEASRDNASDDPSHAETNPQPGLDPHSLAPTHARSPPGTHVRPDCEPPGVMKWGEGDAVISGSCLTLSHPCLAKGGPRALGGECFGQHRAGSVPWALGCTAGGPVRAPRGKSSGPVPCSWA